MKCYLHKNYLLAFLVSLLFMQFTQAQRLTLPSRQDAGTENRTLRVVVSE